MRIKLIVPTIAIFAALLGGCSSEKTNTVPMTSAAESTLKQVQTQLPFKVLLPSSLPHDLKLSNVSVSNNPNTGKPNSVLLQFTSANVFLDVNEQQANGLGHVSFNNEIDVTVKNMKARFHKDDKLSKLIWFDGEKQIVISVPASSDIASEEQLIKIAESFK